MTLTTADRVAKHRAGMKAKGLKEFRIWIPDTSAFQFQENAREQTLAMDIAMREEPDLGEFLAVSGDQLMAALDHAGL
ncbi:MAG: antitoxin MazE family protein [Promicromonosporaceae bacterium]|nr:antitoxin MazE family protein [Promicromonosporaceae bacterium]